MISTENNGMYMPVAPAYGGGGFGGFGGDGWWIILLLLACNGGWGGFGGFGGYGNMALGYDFPWILNGQQGINNNVSGGFRDQMINDSIGEIRTGVQGLSTQLCSGFAGTTAAVTNAQNALSQQLYGNTIAELERSFGVQSALQNCCCENRAGIADLKYTVATENCADRTQSLMNTRDVIENNNRTSQAILDKLCALELDGVKGQLAQAQRDNVELQNRLNMANLAASQEAQTAAIENNIYNRLANCPVPTTPVYGRTPIFTCNNGGCGCSGLGVA